MNVPPAGSVAHGGTPRVIVADDHDWIRQILVRVVQQTLPEAQVIETKDGLQAFEAYQQGGADFLVTNHSMPHMMDLP